MIVNILRTNIQLFECAKEHLIESFVLPAHMTYILQPIDAAYFCSLQKLYSKIVICPYSNITRYNVAERSSKAYQDALRISPKPDVLAQSNCKLPL